jgi:3-oxoacyl-[acyl-carrier-protein] synthase II
VLGEGGGVLVLEEYEHAKARGAKSMPSWRFWHERRCLPHDGAQHVDGPRRSMVMALRNAGVNAEEVTTSMRMARPRRWAT